MSAGAGKPVLKGPGAAVRPPRGTLYRIYGFAAVAPASVGAGVTAAGACAPSATCRTGERGTVYICGRGANETSARDSGGPSPFPCQGDSCGALSCSSHARAVEAMLTTPLGDVATFGEDEGCGTVRSLAWRGRVQPAGRSTVWRLLCNGVPPAPASLGRQQAELRRKREEYEKAVAKCCPVAMADFLRPGGRDSLISWGRQGGASPMAVRLSSDDRNNLTQISSDLPRHSLALFHNAEIASALGRCLFFWSCRYPAVGYVQGIDDIMVVFFSVFLHGAILEFNARHCGCCGGANLSSTLATGNFECDGGGVHSSCMTANTDESRGCSLCISPAVVYTDDVQLFGEALGRLPAEMLRNAEADAYFCGAFFLSWLQDNFVEGQPGIRRSLALMERILLVADPAVVNALTSLGITLMDCCFQWLHCLLSRELPLQLVILLWEKYMAMLNSETIHEFHAYVCAELLIQMRDNVIGQPVDTILRFLKDPLGTRSCQRHHPQSNRSKWDQCWLEKLVAGALLLYRGNPPTAFA